MLTRQGLDSLSHVSDPWVYEDSILFTHRSLEKQLLGVLDNFLKRTIGAKNGRTRLGPPYSLLCTAALAKIAERTMVNGHAHSGDYT